MKTIGIVIVTILVLAGVSAAFIYSGSFNVAADQPHWALTSQVIQKVRDHAIARGARAVSVPASLADPKVIATGAGEYAEMCVACHLAPGMKDTEMRTGLYPKPPNLPEQNPYYKPAEQFWIIKHGLKMTGMPAWGLTHDDERIWTMVAFLQKLPDLSAAEYQQLVESAEGGEHHHEPEPGSM
jgi:mono/diheme cytochrome c family protein